MCPFCNGALSPPGARIQCGGCGRSFPFDGGIADFAEGKYYDNFPGPEVLSGEALRGLSNEDESPRIEDYYLSKIGALPPGPGPERPLRVLDSGCSNGLSVDVLNAAAPLPVRPPACSFEARFSFPGLPERRLSHRLLARHGGGRSATPLHEGGIPSDRARDRVAVRGARRLARGRSAKPHRRLRFNQVGGHWYGRLFRPPMKAFYRLMSAPGFRFLASTALNPYLVLEIRRAR